MTIKDKIKSFGQKTKNGFGNLWHYYRGWKILYFIGLLLVFLLVSYLVLIAKTTNVSTLQEGLKVQTTIYSKYDEPAGSLMAQKGDYVELDQIAEPMKETVIATEDKRFYDHVGFDTRGIARAFGRMLLNRDTSGGGGSTITQQLVKNAFLTLDQTFQRKFKEFFLALEVEKQYSKDQILEMYLNHAYFGNGVWGVEDASWKYFGHSAATLDWNESMVLTGILKGPSIYNPIDDYQAALDRREVIADLMAKDQVIDDELAASVKNSEIYLDDEFYPEDSYQYPAYFDAVINEVARETNIPEDDIVMKGYKIYTYLDEDYQAQLDASYDDNAWLFPDEGLEDEPLVQGASVVVEPSTGGVMAVYGGRGEYTYRGFNRATDMKRSPGSTIKPLAVYVSALEQGYNIHSLVPDEVRSYGRDDYRPENYDHQTDPSGEVELYYALAQSKNTTAVYLMDQLGIQVAVNKLKQFGINIPEADQSLTLALGALSDGVSPLQLANAYSAFANRGVRNNSYFIRKIEDANGKEVYNREKPNKHMVMTPNVAADMTSMMLDTYGGYGTSYGAGPDFGQIAGKSGSTEVSQEDMSTRDRWLVGYTPDFVLVTWMGLDRIDAEGQSLDDLMPTGLSSLYNIQSTRLMSVSPQTPFDVAPASSMGDDTNDFDDDLWREDFDLAFEEVKDNLKYYTDEAIDWLQTQWDRYVN